MALSLTSRNIYTVYIGLISKSQPVLSDAQNFKGAWPCVLLMVMQNCRETEDRQECGLRDQPTADKHGDVISYHLETGVVVTNASF